MVISSSERRRDAKAETVLVVPFTSDTDGQQRLPMPLITQDPSNGLVQGSAAMCGRISCIRKARLDQQIGTDHAQQLRSVRLRVTTMFALNDLLTPRKTDLIIARKDREDQGAQSFRKRLKIRLACLDRDLNAAAVEVENIPRYPSHQFTNLLAGDIKQIGLASRADLFMIALITGIAKIRPVNSGILLNAILLHQ